MDLASVYESIMAHENLPSPNAVALEVLRLTRDPDTDMVSLVRVITTDPAICARIIRTVNAPATGVGRHVASIEAAISLLGFRVVAGIAVACSVLDNNRSGLPEFDYDAFWRRSVAQAVAVKVFAHHAKAMPVDEAFTYGLLCGIGRLALVSVFPQRYREMLLTLGAADESELTGAERTVFSIDSETLSAAMMREWGMPLYERGLAIAAKDATSGSHRESTLVRMCRVAGLLARVLVEPNVDREQLAAVMRGLPVDGIDADLMVWLFQDIVARYREAGAIFQIDTPMVPALAEIYAHARDRASCP